MKPIIKHTAAALLGMSILMTGCASKTPQEAKVDGLEKEAKCFNEMPEWIRNPSVENGLGAVGIGKYTKGGPSFMISEAELYGNASLAAQIKNELTRLKQGNPRKTNISELDAYESNYREIVEGYVEEIAISGAKRINTYQSPCTGDMFVLMSIDFLSLAQGLENSRNSIKKNMENARTTRQAIDEGMKVLDNSIKELRERKNHASSSN